VFTGIVEQIGTIVAREPRGVAARFVVSCTWSDLAMGESIATAGVCLTVAGIRSPIGSGTSFSFEADASPETLERSTLVDARPGRRVNLERALQPQSRMGGHIVGGHVDARGKLLSRRAWGDAEEFRFELPKSIARFVAPKGSITIDGVSLTVNHVRDTESGGDFDVVIVPHTMRNTTLVDLSVGAPVNLEVDVLARYVVRHLEAPRHDAVPTNASNDESILRALRDGGFLSRS
jgi:riboflavin synthase